MRKLGVVDSSQPVGKLVKALLDKTIDVQLQKENSEIEIWIFNEDYLAPAKSLLIEFQRNPDAEPFAGLAASPLKFNTPYLEAPTQAPPKSGKRVFRRQKAMPTFNGIGPVTIGLVGLSIIATFILDGEGFQWLQSRLYYSEYSGRSFPEIRAGQLWRLVTPIFMHGGILHIFFNMMWIIELGSQVEQQERSSYLAGIVLIFACFVNTAQYLVSGPAFIGMSGVLYALLGYTWMMSRYARKFNYFLAPGTVMMMVIWMAICMLGIIGNVANTQHFAGFLIGIIWGYLRSGELKLWIRRKLRKKLQ